MTLDLQHNKIVKDTITPRFEESLRVNLVPMIEAKYGSDVLSIQMYEDYISDNFADGGAWYYPMTVVKADGAVTEWVKWNMSKGAFKDGVPYAYTGGDYLEFAFAEPPAFIAKKLEGRAIYYSGEGLPVRVETVVPNPTFLSGKYSQTFIDEMSRQLTKAICEAMAIETLDGSTFSLALVFAPESYMEHTSENVTYRRLLIVDKGSAPRDFWIKWTRLDGATAYSVADHVSAENIVFEIGEDVSQKVREKEYRCLIRLGKDKYHNAMGRKNVTEWRDLFKRAIRRGELVRVEPTLDLGDNNAAINEQLAKVLGTQLPTAPATPAEQSDEQLTAALEDINGQLARALEADPPAPAETQPDEEEESDDFALALQKLAEEDAEQGEQEEQTSDSFVFEGLDVEESDSDEDAFALDEDEDEDESDDILVVDERGVALGSDDEEEDADDEEYIDEPEDDDGFFDEPDEDDSAVLSDEDEDTLLDVRALEPDDEPDEDIVEDVAEEAAPAPIEADTPAPVAAKEESTPAVAENVVAVNTADIEAKIRAEIEAKIRLEYETKARARAEEEAERLRREQDQLRSENERLQAQMARERREQAIKEEELRAEEARLRAQIELQLRAETRERERYAEAARVAVEEQRRLEAEQAKMQRDHADVINRHNEERRMAEEARRAEAAKAKEAEQARAEAAKATPAPEPVKEDTKYTYTSKVVRLIFRRSVDPNITSRIHEIIKVTLEYYGKDKIYLKVKATVPDSETVCLEFVKIPMEEMELLRNIIKVLGNSGLGIARAILE